MSAWPPITEIVHNVQSGKTTAAKMVEQALNAITDKQAYKAVIATTEKRARLRAAEVDLTIKKSGSAGRLAGVPFIAKDNFLVFGANSTAASNMLKSFDTPYQSTAIDRLEMEGAICVAKANLDAFGHGSSTENSDFFVTRNAHDATRVPGGSSGGPATAVVLGMVPFALGTDTGGSNRQPASFSGCIGYKPTYGLVSRSGVVAMASSTDTIGPLANRVEDAALVLDVIAGQDPLDSVTVKRDKDGYELPKKDYDLQKVRVGVVSEYLPAGLDTGVKQTILQAINTVKKAGASVERINLPSLPLALAAYYVIVPAEISSNLSRYDGQRYGYSDASAKDLLDSYTRARTNGFNTENKRRIMVGTYVLSSGYYDAYYKQAQTVRTKLMKEFDQIFQKVDILIGPTSPTTAFKIGQNSDPLKMYLGDIMTVAASLAGIPAISIPAGMSRGLPVGIQLMMRQHSDRKLLCIAKAVEKVLS
jgi:aspartyl-tRNA(Asn)/glutamyl-tRNA(Gln) amidotransferase subunit A